MKWYYQVTEWLPLGDTPLIKHLDKLGQDGWEVFHLHEVHSESVPVILIVSKRGGK